MHIRFVFVLAVTISLAEGALAQVALTEGTIKYEVKVQDAGYKDYNASYTIAVKNGRIRKEMLWNGRSAYVVIIDYNSKKAYVLKDINSKCYAVERSLADLQSSQERYIGYTLSVTAEQPTVQAGVKAKVGLVKYRDGNEERIEFSPDLYIDKGLAFEEFPDARMLPLLFKYNQGDQAMTFVARSIDKSPVSESLFRIPDNYKIISNEEFKQATR